LGESFLASRNNKSISKKVSAQTVVTPTNFRRPFWLPSISYYFLSFSIAVTLFFLIWGILYEGGEQTPWITAGVFASLILISAVITREVFLRNARNRYLIASRQLDYNLSKIPQISRVRNERPKFTLQQNSVLLNRIEEKSAAARVLKRLPEGHLEVLEICNEYLHFTKNELRRIDLNSPRFPAVKRSRRKVKKIHRYHLLAWAEIETKRITRLAKNRASVEGKIETARKALNILDSAISFYPNDKDLIASHDAVNEFISRTKISGLIEEAEKFVFVSDYKSAIGKYRDLLFLLNQENFGRLEKKEFVGKIEREIQRLSLLHDQEYDLETVSDQRWKDWND
jgi:hypothetical protein